MADRSTVTLHLEWMRQGMTAHIKQVLLEEQAMLEEQLKQALSPEVIRAALAKEIAPALRLEIENLVRSAIREALSDDKLRTAIVAKVARMTKEWI